MHYQYIFDKHDVPLSFIGEVDDKHYFCYFIDTDIYFAKQLSAADRKLIFSNTDTRDVVDTFYQSGDLIVVDVSTANTKQYSLTEYEKLTQQSLRHYLPKAGFKFDFDYLTGKAITLTDHSKPLSTDNVVFNDKDKLVRYIIRELPVLSHITIQKTLYLLYAYYGASYGKMTANNSELEENYPPYLFNARFDAQAYGPIEFDVKASRNADAYSIYENDNYASESTNDLNIPLGIVEARNVRMMIDSVIQQTSQMDDFSLVDRTHQDIVWFNAYHNGQDDNTMNNDGIITEYASRYIKA